jgi:hypothetical protein
VIRYLTYLATYLVMLVVAVIVTPVLPAFKQWRIGGWNNDEMQATGWRLPVWLAWFDTPDNALTGDEAFSKAHPNGTYMDMVAWLYRNPLYGFKWSVLGYPIAAPELIVERGEGVYSYFDAFMWRKPWLGKKRTFGWLLDAYYQRENKEPKAIFVFWN